MRGAGLGPTQAPSRGTRLIQAGAVTALVAGVLAAGWLLELGPFAERQLSRGELIARGDAICSAAREAFRDLQTAPPQSAEQAAALTEQLLEIAEAESEELAALDGPEDVMAELGRYLAARQRGIELLRKGRSAAERNRPQAYARSQAELAATQLKRARLAHDIGFASCSEPLVGREELAEQARPPDEPVGG